MSGENRGQWFANAMAAISGRLPFGLSAVVPPNVVGYLLINGCTFGLDLLLLTTFHGGLGVALPVAVTLSYGVASLVSYACNRILNFRSHGNVGRQLPLYVVILTINYLVFILGLVDLLAALGVEYQVARVLAACCEGVFLYCCMRWLVFRDAMGNKPVASHHSADQHGADRHGAGQHESAAPGSSRGGTAHEEPATAGIAPTPEAPHRVAAEPER
jgi:putative flippase GtrA